MQKWVTKNNVVVFLGLCSLALIFLEPQSMRDYCYNNNLPCVFMRNFLLPLAWGSFPVALLLLFLRDELFRSWLRFLAWWLPVGYILSYGFGYSTGYISIELWNTRLTSFVILSFSLLLFIIKTWELRRQEAGTPIAPWLVWTILVLAFAASLVPGYIYGLIW